MSSNHRQPPQQPRTTSSSPFTGAVPPQSEHRQQQRSQQQAKKPDSSCISCVRLITEILQNPESRPRQVLQSLTGSHYAHDFRMEPLEDGVQVQMNLPMTPHRLPRRWTRVTPSKSSDRSTTASLQERVSSTLGPTPLATSSSAMDSVVAPSYRSEMIKIECRKCDTVGPEKGARALIMGPTPLSIVACTNRLTPNHKDEMAEVLTHELLHAYDVKRLQLDFTDCESMAYSEVRAAREAECASWNMMKEYCVNQKAIAATHNLFPATGRNCVRQVFSAAYADRRPFDQKQQSQQQQQP